MDLRPLNREQIEEVLAHVLDGTVPAATVDAVWSASGGNPRILDALLHDAAEAGVLAKRNGIWILLGPLPSDGDRIGSVVAKEHLRRPPEEQEALKLVALAGPVSRKVIEDISGAEVVRSLLDQQMVVEHPSIPAELSSGTCSWPQTIRNTISVSTEPAAARKNPAAPGPIPCCTAKAGLVPWSGPWNAGCGSLTPSCSRPHGKPWTGSATPAPA